jgi:hypothetical protein
LVKGYGKAVKLSPQQIQGEVSHDDRRLRVNHQALNIEQRSLGTGQWTGFKFVGFGDQQPWSLDAGGRQPGATQVTESIVLRQRGKTGTYQHLPEAIAIAAINPPEMGAVCSIKLWAEDSAWVWVGVQ